MSNLVLGLGVQGKKRIQNLKKNCIVVDPINPDTNYKDISNVPLEKIKYAYICTPENQKFKLIKTLLKKNINILVEKPIIFKNKEFKIIKGILKKKKSTLYTAYNHRFEPHIVEVKRVLDQKKIGKIYNVNLYYGNGTSQLWKNNWREKNKYSIIHDLGVHLLDIFDYWFEFFPSNFKTNYKSKNELSCYDYFSFSSNDRFLCNFTTSIINWRNTFKADIIGSKGSIHIDCLCKWGPSKLIVRKRKFPSGKPSEKIKVLKMQDPTWALEEKYFKKISKLKISNFNNDININKCIQKIK